MKYRTIVPAILLCFLASESNADTSCEDVKSYREGVIVSAAKLIRLRTKCISYAPQARRGTFRWFTDLDTISHDWRKSDNRAVLGIEYSF